MSCAIKPRDPAIMALVAAASVRRIVPKAATPKARGPITMSRKAAAPVRPSVTQGFSFRSLRDR